MATRSHYWHRFALFALVIVTQAQMGIALAVIPTVLSHAIE